MTFIICSADPVSTPFLVSEDLIVRYLKTLKVTRSVLLRPATGHEETYVRQLTMPELEEMEGF